MIDYGKHISIHAPREGGDLALRYKATTSSFQSTPPARGGDVVAAGLLVAINISIHAPREGGDKSRFTLLVY